MPHDQQNAIAGDQLRSFIERIERLEDEKANISEDVKMVFAEAKATGFDVKIMRNIIRIRKLSEDEALEQDYLMDMYKAALGMALAYDDDAA